MTTTLTNLSHAGCGGTIRYSRWRECDADGRAVYECREWTCDTCGAAVDPDTGLSDGWAFCHGCGRAVPAGELRFDGRDDALCGACRGEEEAAV